MSSALRMEFEAYSSILNNLRNLALELKAKEPLIPDMLQRFFGIPINSKWGQKYTEMVLKNLRPVPPGK